MKIERAMSATGHIVTSGEAKGWRGIVRLLMAALLALLPASVDAQELTVVSFEASMNEYIAAEMQRRDYNGDICAIVKVQLPVEGAEFEGYVDFLPP